MEDGDIIVQKNQYGVDTYVFDPYNPLNKLISKNTIESILRKYGVDTPIHNMELYKRAFIHESYTKKPNLENEINNIVLAPKPDNCLPLFTKSNERLEFIGDGVLECITKFYLYKRFPKENEGFMTQKKIALVKNESIGKIAYEIGLHHWYVLSKNKEEKQTRTNLKKLGCLFESFLGALFLDFNRVSVKDEHGWFDQMFVTGPGFQIAQVFLESVFEQHVDWVELVKNDDNYKNILQVKIQKEFKTTPVYMEMSSYDLERGLTMAVFLCLGQPKHNLKPSTAIPITQFQSYQEIHQHVSENGKILVFLGEGTHKVKKKAEQIACEEIIRTMQRFE